MLDDEGREVPPGTPRQTSSGPQPHHDEAATRTAPRTRPPRRCGPIFPPRASQWMRKWAIIGRVDAEGFVELVGNAAPRT